MIVEFFQTYWYFIIALGFSGVTLGLSIDKIENPFVFSIIIGLCWPLFLIALITMMLKK